MKVFSLKEQLKAYHVYHLTLIAAVLELEANFSVTGFSLLEV